MSPDQLSPSHELLERDALTWVRRLASGNVTYDDLEELKQWCGKSPAHRDAFARASHLWNALGIAGQNIRTHKVGQSPALPPAFCMEITPRPPVSRRLILGGTCGAAMAAIITVLVGHPLMIMPFLREASADVRTEVGEQRDIMLPSGVSVALNTRTSINLRSGSSETEQIELVSGEAIVSTGPHAPKTIEVMAADGRITATHAQFNILCDSKAVDVTCLSGKVSVEHRAQRIVLAEQQQVSYSPSGLSNATVVNPGLVCAWQEGTLIFQSTPLAKVVEEVNRYRTGQVILLNEELGRKPVNGRFPIARVNDIVVLVSTVFGAKATSLPGGFVILS